MKKIKHILFSLLLFISSPLFASPRIQISEFNISGNTLSLAFNLREAANQELLALIFSNRAVRIAYKIDILKKEGIFRKDSVAWGSLSLNSLIRFDAFSRVFTVDYREGNTESRKKFVRTSNMRKTIRMIVSHFFNKIWRVNVPLNTLDRSRNSFTLRITAWIESVKLAPPYNIINSSFNFKIEELRDF